MLEKALIVGLCAGLGILVAEGLIRFNIAPRKAMVWIVILFAIAGERLLTG